MLGSILFSTFGKTEHTLSKATDGWGEGGEDAAAHSLDVRLPFRRPSRGWRDGQQRTHEFERQAQSPIFGKEQPHAAV